MPEENAWSDSSNVLDAVADALNRFDWSEVERLCRSGSIDHPALLERLNSAIIPFPPRKARDLLQMLRRKRRFELMCILADAFLRSGTGTHEIRRQYAQAMIDQGNLTSAEDMLKQILADPGAPLREQYEANGLLGRIYKQLYVNAHLPENPRQQENLAKAIQFYWRAYTADRQNNTWQGVNALALLARARRDGVAPRWPELPDEKTLTREIQSTLAEAEEKKGALKYWDIATAMETAIAAHDLAESQSPELAQQFSHEAVEQVRRYMRDVEVDAFECASTLRQLREVWELNANGSPGDFVIPALQATLLKREGGELRLQGRDIRDGLEKNFSGENDLPLIWWQTGLQRCMAVARVDTSSGKAIGSGFLIDPVDFVEDAGQSPVLLTNWHVISRDAEYPGSVAPEGATVYFEGCAKRYKVNALFAFSSKLDATFVSLEPMDPKQTVCPLKPPAAQFDPAKKQRLYVIGHPGGRNLSFSLFDSLWLDSDGMKLHYRTPTEGGSSGSPVFDQENWTLVALHHSGLRDMPYLHGNPGTYQANEGIAMGAIREAIRLNRMS